MERSRICIALIENTLDANLEVLEKYREYVDIVELRADFLSPAEFSKIHTFPAKAELPVILTFRKPEDGGKFTDSEEVRFDLIKEAMKGPFAFVDLEEGVGTPDLLEAVKKGGARVIRSFHDFNGVPADLEERLCSLTQGEDEIPKAAVMPNSTEDLLRILQCAAATRKKEKILLGMGNWGFPTRVLATWMGSYLTFCSAEAKSAAPGHIDPGTLCERYRFKKTGITPDIYGIIGNPVMHTASPVIHNKGYDALELDAVYVPFQVDDVEVFTQIVKLLNIRGFSVTIPHKENIIPLLDRQEESVQVIGACNTVFNDNGKLVGSNTDGVGFVTPLKQAFGEKLKGMKATVIGAGGAAKAVVYALQKEGVDVLILNRTVAKAEKLAAGFGCPFGGLDEAGIAQMAGYSDIIAQTTNVGMSPDIDNNPVAAYTFKGHETAYDIIYKPLKTRFLEKADEAGCFFITGDKMLLFQAYGQFKTFTGKEYPIAKV